MDRMVSPAAQMEIPEMQTAFSQQSKGYGHKVRPFGDCISLGIRYLNSLYCLFPKAGFDFNQDVRGITITSRAL